MSIALTRKNSFVLFIVSSLVLLALETWVARGIHSLENPEVLAVAITADIAVGIPLLYYVLLARRKYLPTGGIIGLYFLALAVVRLILPAPYSSHLDFVKLLVPIGELYALILILLKVRGLIKHVRMAQAAEIYFVDALKTGLQQSFGRSLFAALLATELSLLFFALFGWLKRFHLAKADHSVFFYHRGSGFTSLLSAIVFVLVLETTALHLIVQIWSVSAAWILTGLSIYTLLWMMGYYQSTRLQPIVIDSARLHLRTGFRWRATIMLSNIVEVRKARSADRRGDHYLNAAILGQPRLVLCLNNPETVTGLFGKSRQVSLIGITVDNEKGFLAELNRFTPPRPEEN